MTKLARGLLSKEQVHDADGAEKRRRPPRFRCISQLEYIRTRESDGTTGPTYGPFPVKHKIDLVKAAAEQLDEAVSRGDSDGVRKALRDRHLTKKAILAAKTEARKKAEEAATEASRIKRPITLMDIELHHTPERYLAEQTKYEAIVRVLERHIAKMTQH